MKYFFCLTLIFLGSFHQKSASQYPLPVIDCSSEYKKINLAFQFGASEENWKKTIALPTIGKFAVEDHYVTNHDVFPYSRLFPIAREELIEEHLENSFTLYQKYNTKTSFQKLYPYNNRVWTKSEGGEIGQGSIGDGQVRLLSPEMELWLLTMMWEDGEKPIMGTKFLVKANGKAVVVIAGFETGPRYQKFVGGLTQEVHHWLGTTDESQIEIHYLKNQNVPFGPVICQ